VAVHDAGRVVFAFDERDAPDSVQDLGFEHVEADVAEREERGPEVHAGVAFASIVGAGVLGGPGRDAGNHPLARTDTGVVTQGAAIHRPVDEHAVHPAFEDGRRSEPPEWEVHDQ